LIKLINLVPRSEQSTFTANQSQRSADDHYTVHSFSGGTDISSSVCN